MLVSLCDSRYMYRCTENQPRFRIISEGHKNHNVVFGPYVYEPVNTQSQSVCVLQILPGQAPVVWWNREHSIMWNPFEVLSDMPKRAQIMYTLSLLEFGWERYPSLYTAFCDAFATEQLQGDFVMNFEDASQLQNFVDDTESPEFIRWIHTYIYFTV